VDDGMTPSDAAIVREALVFMRDCGSRAGESTIADAALEAFARLTERLDRYEKALREIQAFQLRRLETYKEHGTVFDVSKTGDPTSWQGAAFWTYVDLCEVESIASAALNEEGESETGAVAVDPRKAV
jgi:hypothetical protein